MSVDVGRLKQLSQLRQLPATHDICHDSCHDICHSVSTKGTPTFACDTPSSVAAVCDTPTSIKAICDMLPRHPSKLPATHRQLSVTCRHLSQPSVSPYSVIHDTTVSSVTRLSATHCSVTCRRHQLPSSTPSYSTHRSLRHTVQHAARLRNHRPTRRAPRETASCGCCRCAGSRTSC